MFASKFQQCYQNNKHLKRAEEYNGWNIINITANMSILTEQKVYITQEFSEFE